MQKNNQKRQVCQKAAELEKSRERIEKRTAYVTTDIDWLYGKDKWINLACIGAINTKVETSNGKTDEWHYFISSRPISAEELLKHARLEWSVETMHWLLDVHFSEDFFRVNAEFAADTSGKIIKKTFDKNETLLEAKSVEIGVKAARKFFNVMVHNYDIPFWDEDLCRGISYDPDLDLLLEFRDDDFDFDDDELDENESELPDDNENDEVDDRIPDWSVEIKYKNDTEQSINKSHLRSRKFIIPLL